MWKQKGPERITTGVALGGMVGDNVGGAEGGSPKGNYVRHARGCARLEGEGHNRGVRGQVRESERCGKVFSVANMTRH